MLITSDEKKKLSKKITWISILLVIILSIVFSISTYIYFQIEPLVASRIKETIKTSTDGLYRISFSNITINPFNGNVILRDIVFKADPTTYKQFKQKGINPNHLYDIRVKSLKVLIEGFSKKSKQHYAGRNDHNAMVVFPVNENYKPGEYAYVLAEECTTATLLGTIVG